MAYQLAEIHGINHAFVNRMAGVDWMKKFLERQKPLSLRKPEATSAARAAALNKAIVNLF